MLDVYVDLGGMPEHGALQERLGAFRLGDLGLDVTLRVHADSDACRGTCRRTGPIFVKHLDVTHLWIQGAVDTRCVEHVVIHGAEKPANFMTQGLKQAAD